MFSRLAKEAWAVAELAFDVTADGAPNINHVARLDRQIVEADGGRADVLRRAAFADRDAASAAGTRGHDPAGTPPAVETLRSLRLGEGRIGRDGREERGPRDFHRRCRFPELGLGFDYILIRDIDLLFQGVEFRIVIDFPPFARMASSLGWAGFQSPGFCRPSREPAPWA